MKQEYAHKPGTVIRYCMHEYTLENRLAVRSFPAAQPKGILLIAPATGVKQQVYDNLATGMAEAGYTTLTFDYSGIGLSKPGTGHEVTATRWGQDLDTVLAHMRSTYTHQKLLLMGHSIGGQLAGLSEHTPHLNGLILVAAQSGYWKFWPKNQQKRMWLNWHVLMPLLTQANGYFPGKRFKMENLPKGVALEWAKWCRSPHYLFDHVPQAQERYARIQVPTIAYSFADDTFAPKASVDWLAERYTGTDTIRKHFTPQDLQAESVGHFGILKSKFRDTLWADVVNELHKL